MRSFLPLLRHIRGRLLEPLGILLQIRIRRWRGFYNGRLLRTRTGPEDQTAGEGDRSEKDFHGEEPARERADIPLLTRGRVISNPEKQQANLGKQAARPGLARRPQGPPIFRARE